MKFNINFTGKILLLLGACLAGAGTSFAIEWGSVDNLASGSAVTVSSNEGAAATITDNNDGSSWQAQGGANRYADDWAMIDLGEDKTFTDLEIMWEASHPTVYGIYVSKTAIPFAPTEFNRGSEENPDMVTYNVIDSDWLAANTPVAKGGEESESGFTDNITFPKVTARYILVYCEEYNGWAANYGSRIFQVRVANIADRTSVQALAFEGDASVMEGNSIELRAVALNVTDEELDLSMVSDLTLTADKEGVEISGGADGVYTIHGVAPGNYTLTLTGEADGQTLTAEMSFTVLYDWDKVAERRFGHIGGGRMTENDEPIDYNGSLDAAYDDNPDTYYEYDGNWGGGDSWILINLMEGCFIDAVGVMMGEHSGGKMRIYYAYNPSQIENVEKIADITPAQLGLDMSEWTATPVIDRTSNEISTYIFDQPIRATHLIIADVDNPEGKPQYRDIYLKGEMVKPAVPTTFDIEIEDTFLVVGETVNFFVTMYDQYGEEIQEEIHYELDGEVWIGPFFEATEEGEHIMVIRSWEAETQIVFTVVDLGEEVAMDMYQSIRLNDEENPNLHNDNIIDFGTSDYKTLSVDLMAAHNLKAVELHWEGACPTAYELKVTYLDGSTAVLDCEVDRVATPGRTFIDRIHHIGSSAMRRVAGNSNHSMDLSNVMSLQLTPRAAGNDVWGVKLVKAKVYGTAAEGVDFVEGVVADDAPVNVYNAAGVLIRSNVEAASALEGLPAGLYIAGGRKIRKL